MKKDTRHRSDIIRSCLWVGTNRQSYSFLYFCLDFADFYKKCLLFSSPEGKVFFKVTLKMFLERVSCSCLSHSVLRQTKHSRGARGNDYCCFAHTFLPSLSSVRFSQTPASLQLRHSWCRMNDFSPPCLLTTHSSTEIRFLEGKWTLREFRQGYAKKNSCRHTVWYSVSRGSCPAPHPPPNAA